MASLWGNENKPFDRLHDVMCLQNSVYDGDVLSRNLVYSDVTDFIARIVWVDEEEEIPAVECWFHRAARRGQRATCSVLGDDIGRNVDTHLRTTTIGDSVLVISPRPFQIMRPEARTEAKLRI
jgi:hypothetical protein